jgi:hypothetical protein
MSVMAILQQQSASASLATQSSSSTKHRMDALLSVEELFKFNGGLHSAFSPKNRNPLSRTLPF